MHVENKPAMPTTPIVRPAGFIDSGISVPKETKRGLGCELTVTYDTGCYVAMHKIDGEQVRQSRGNCHRMLGASESTNLRYPGKL